MTKEELKRKKAQLEINIFNAIKGFEEETGVAVTTVTLSHYEEIAATPPFQKIGLVQCSIKVEEGIEIEGL